MILKSIFLLPCFLVWAQSLAGAGPQGGPALAAAPPKTEAGTKMVVPDAHGVGYVLVAPRFSDEVVLLDGLGKEAHVWSTPCKGAGGVRLLPDGGLLRLARGTLPPPFNQCGVDGGRLQHLSWDGRILWDFLDATSEHMAHGDLLRLPNGNILVSVLEFHSRQECEAKGRDPGLMTDKGLLMPALMEFTPKGKSGAVLVWRWSLWDHLYQGRNPNLPDYKYPGEMAGRVDLGTSPSVKGSVWMTPVEIDYQAEEDLISLVVGGLGEVWLIDHSTSTKEAATAEGGKRGRGGDLLLRWKGPLQTAADRKSSVVSAEWQDHPVGSKGLGWIVARMEGPPAVTRVEKISLDPVSLAVNHETELFRGAALPAQDKTSRLSASIVSAASHGPIEGALVVTDGLHGIVRQVGQGLSSWTYENARGKAAFTPMVTAKDVDCCGGDASSAVSKAPLKASSPGKTEPVYTAPVAKARFYGADFLGPSR